MSAALQIFQMAQRSTASRTGNSYWEVAQNCGERRYLSDQHKALVEASEVNVEDKRRGTYTHALLDFWLKGQVDRSLLLDAGPVQDLEYIEAVKMFKFYTEHFAKDYWGAYVASEVKLPVNDEHRGRIASRFGHDEVTGAIDALYLLSAADAERLRATWPTLGALQPGLYAIDWKTAKARAGDDKASGAYSNSIQAKLYPLLWNLAGGEHCQGMIHVVLVNHKEMRRHDLDKRNLSSVQVFLAPWSEARDRQAVAAVNFARSMRDLRTRNPYACEDYSGRRCPFLDTLCPGF